MTAKSTLHEDGTQDLKLGDLVVPRNVTLWAEERGVQKLGMLWYDLDVAVVVAIDNSFNSPQCAVISRLGFGWITNASMSLERIDSERP